MLVESGASTLGEYTVTGCDRKITLDEAAKSRDVQKFITSSIKEEKARIEMSANDYDVPESVATNPKSAAVVTAQEHVL